MQQNLGNFTRQDVYGEALAQASATNARLISQLDQQQAAFDAAVAKIETGAVTMEQSVRAAQSGTARGALRGTRQGAERGSRKGSYEGSAQGTERGALRGTLEGSRRARSDQNRLTYALSRTGARVGR